MTEKRFIKEQPDTVRSYAKSQIEAIHRIYTRKRGLPKVMTKYFGGKIERDILERSWKLLTDGNMLPQKQHPSLDGLRFILPADGLRGSGLLGL